MTIVVSITVPEGIVFAADSRQIFVNARGDVRVGSDYVYKIYQLGPRVAATAWGWGFLMGRNIQSYINDFKVTVADQSLSVEETAKALGQYLHQQYKAHVENKYNNPVDPGSYALALLVGGYDANDRNGKVYEVYVPEGEYYLRNMTEQSPGASWRGHTFVISRLIKGVDPRIDQVSGYTPESELAKSLEEAPLNYDVDYRSMPLQDAVDLAVFLVHITIEMQRFSDGIRMAPGASANCGGPIDIAVIDPGEGFRWIQRKTLRGERPSLVRQNAET